MELSDKELKWVQAISKLVVDEDINPVQLITIAAHLMEDYEVFVPEFDTKKVLPGMIIGTNEFIDQYKKNKKVPKKKS